MFILKSLTNDDERCCCEISAYDTFHDANVVMESQIQKCCDLQGLHPDDDPENIDNVFVSLERDAGFASICSGINSYSWEIIEFPEYGRKQENTAKETKN